MSSFDEFSFIKSIKPKERFHSELIEGIGDDAAVYRPDHASDQLVCMDTMIDGIHFSEKTMSAQDVGWKALAANLSDIAAMGGIADYYLVSIAIPKSWIDRASQIYEGLEACGRFYQVDLIGGDTVASHHALMINVTVIGHLPVGEEAYLRSCAVPGDKLLVTGTLGDSAAGLSILLDEDIINPEPYMESLIKAHQRPEPQLKAAKLLRQSGGRFSVNDISDGLSSEANELAAASKVGIEISADQLPISKESLSYSNEDRSLMWALEGGEDYQLLISAPADTVLSLSDLFAKNGVPLTEIGVITEEAEHVWLIKDKQKQPLHPKGYNHFAKNEG